MRWIAPLALLLAAVSARAVDLGPLQWNRPAGQAPFAEIPLVGSASLAPTDVIARVASPDAYRVAGLRYEPSLAQVRVDLRKAPDGQYLLRLEGLPRDGGPLDLLLTVRDRLSVSVAEYRIDLTTGQSSFAPAPAGTALANSGRTAAPAGSAARPTATAVPAPAAAVAAVTTPASAPTPSRVAAAAPAPALVPAPVPAAAVAAPALKLAPPTAAAPAPTAAASATPGHKPDQPASADDLAGVRAAVVAWADAWSRRDVDGYLRAYVPDYVPPLTGAPTAAWAAERRQRIEGRQRISVKVSQLRLVRHGPVVIARFVQDYRSDEMHATERKQLVLERHDGRWLIRREHVLR